MRIALREAEKAFDAGEVPVGAVVVANEHIIAKGHNQTELLRDVTAHAEMLAITGAANNLGAKYLGSCTLYVTLEPCVMCAGALSWSQMGAVVYGASDPKSGYARFEGNLLHKRTKIKKGILAEESVALMQSFFRSRRKK